MRQKRSANYIAFFIGENWVTLEDEFTQNEKAASNIYPISLSFFFRSNSGRLSYERN